MVNTIHAESVLHPLPHIIVHMFLRPRIVLYGFTISYVLAPLAGAPFTSTELIQLVGAVPESLKIAAKTLLAGSFAFHSWNGLRHLSWDVGKCTYCSKLYSMTHGIYK